MDVTLEALGLDKLSREDRWKLAGLLHDSVLMDGPPPLSEAFKAELDRRIADEEANPDEGTPWREAMERLRAGLRQP